MTIFDNLKNGKYKNVLINKIENNKSRNESSFFFFLKKDFVSEKQILFPFAYDAMKPKNL